MKMGYIVVDNLKGFTQNRPPLVVFMLCLGLFAVALLSLAYYVKLNDVQNPDVSQDWNIFLEQLSKLDFCITNNTDHSTTTTSSPKTTTLSKAPKKAVEATALSHKEGDTMRNYSMPLLITITPTPNFLQIQHNVTHITGTVYGKQLGLSSSAAEIPINVTAELPYAWNSSLCDSIKCQAVQFHACVYFTAASNVFPTGGHPDTCHPVAQESGVEYHVRMRTRDHKDHPLPYYYCRSMPIMTVDHKYNPRLTVMLSLEDRSIINLHLLHTSYFLFVMVVMLFCYALLRGRPITNKVTQTDKIPLTT